MTAKSALEMLKRFGLSFRRNWGLKLVSLAFAILLWNYVIVDTNATRQNTYNNIVMRPASGIEQLNSRKLTVKGDISTQLKNVSVTIELKRNEVGLVNSDNIQAWIDLSGITKEGKQNVHVNVVPPRGTVKRVSPETISITVEKLDTRAVPVAYKFTGDLPAGYWKSEPTLYPPKMLTISGAVTDVEKVDRAVLYIPLTDLKTSLYSAVDFELQDKNGDALPQGGLTKSDANGQVSMTVLPKKPVRIDAGPSLSGSVAPGYRAGPPEVTPATIEIAGPPDVLASLDVLTLGRIDLTGKRDPFSETRVVDLPDGVYAVAGNTVVVHVPVEMKMTTKTLDNLPVSVTGLSPGLKVDEKLLLASVVVNFPELMSSYVKPSHIHLHVDATGLGLGAHTLTIWAEADVETGITEADIEIKPQTILVTILTGQ